MAALGAVLRPFRSGDVPPVLQPGEAFSITYPEGTLSFTPGIPAAADITLTLNEQSTPVDVLDSFEPEIFNQAVRSSPGYWWIHGACLMRDNALTLLVAESGTGKTTLSLGMLTRGYTLLTDDIILINPDSGEVLPIPRCPKIRPPAPAMLLAAGFNLARETERMGRYVLLPSKYIHAMPVKAPVTRVIFLERDAAYPAGIEPLSLTDGLLELLPRSNLLVMDSSLETARQFFAGTQFYRANLSLYMRDLEQITAL